MKSCLKKNNTNKKKSVSFGKLYYNLEGIQFKSISYNESIDTSFNSEEKELKINKFNELIFAGKKQKILPYLQSFGLLMDYDDDIFTYENGFSIQYDKKVMNAFKKSIEETEPKNK